MVYESRWAADEKIRIMLESLNTGVSTAEFCSEHGVSPPAFYSWREKFFRGGKRALSGQPRDPANDMEAEKTSTPPSWTTMRGAYTPRSDISPRASSWSSWYVSDDD